MPSLERKVNVTLGWDVHRRLKKLGIETPFFTDKRFSYDESTFRIAEHFKDILRCLNMNLNDDSIRDTAKRVSKMYVDELFWGLDYAKFPQCTAVDNKMQYDELLVQRCKVQSMCEHHFVPFTGTATIGYLPKTKVLGLSKMNRLVDFFSRRPQVQERLTTQITAALSFILDTEDVAVTIRCEHMCVKLRGIQDELSLTTTSKMDGKFRSNPALREEFLLLSR